MVQDKSQIDRQPAQISLAVDIQFKTCKQQISCYVSGVYCLQAFKPMLFGKLSCMCLVCLIVSKDGRTSSLECLQKHLPSSLLAIVLLVIVCLQRACPVDDKLASH